MTGRNRAASKRSIPPSKACVSVDDNLACTLFGTREAQCWRAPIPSHQIIWELFRVPADLPRGSLVAAGGHIFPCLVETGYFVCIY